MRIQNPFLAFFGATLFVATTLFANPADPVDPEPKDNAYRASSFGIATTSLVAVAVAGVFPGVAFIVLAKGLPVVIGVAFGISLTQKVVSKQLSPERVARFSFVLSPLHKRLKEEAITPYFERLGYGLAMYHDFAESLLRDGRDYLYDMLYAKEAEEL